LKKGIDSMRVYLQRIKATRDGLAIVGVQTDNEELLYIILKGLPKEFASFCSVIRTRDDPISFKKLFVLLQTEEHFMRESSEINTAMAMFASNNKQQG
jgi:hypothetical protein